MQIKKAKWLVVLLAIAMLAIVGSAGVSNNGNVNGCDDCVPFLEVDLIAGQNMKVGSVTVTNDADQLCVTYALNEGALDEGWLIYETHLYVGDCSFDGVLTRPNRRLGGPYQANPIPGKFPYGDDDLGGVEEWTFCISFEELGFGICDDVCIAAHAVIEREECVLVAEAPFGPKSIVESSQGLRKDKTPVREGRSDPNAVLTWNTNKVETDFFSLGFKFDEEGNALDEGGWIIVEFNCSIPNGDGPDILVVEDTWGTYPLESADVYASKDGLDWVLLGEATNDVRDATYNWQTISEFDLGDLDCAKFIKVVDTTPIGLMPNDGDGFDLNTVQALQDCYDCTTYDETAWGDGDRFNERGNWGMFFNYKICEPEEPCVPASIIYGVTGNGSTGGLYQIELTDDEIKETLIKDIAGVGGATGFYPNGLAYDDVNNRLYFAIRKSGVSTTNLYFWDFEGDIVEAATGLPAEIYGATWGAGKYWFIQNGSGNMYTVDFDIDGKNGNLVTFETDIAGLKRFNFGDMALAPDELVIYVSTSFSGTNKEFFKYDLTKNPGERYSLITTTTKAVGLQLGFAEDGVLYGHNTFGEFPKDTKNVDVKEMEWFAVDKGGTVISLGIGENAYNDLASGPSVCD